MYDDVAPSAMMFVDFFSRSAILSAICESPDPLTQCTCLIEPHVLYCMCGFEDLRYADACLCFCAFAQRGHRSKHSWPSVLQLCKFFLHVPSLWHLVMYMSALLLSRLALFDSEREH